MRQDPDNGGLRQTYSNFFKVGYNAAEFLLDFGRQFEDTDPEFFERIIMNPAQAKALWQLFDQSIRGYEQRFGIIREDPDS